MRPNRWQQVGRWLAKTWDVIFTALMLAIVVVAVISVIRAILLTPVAVENKSRMEEQFRQNFREGGDAESGNTGGNTGGIQDTSAQRPTRDP